MRKINSIHYGDKVIIIGLFIAILTPLAVKCLNVLLQNSALEILMWCFVGIGSLILLAFFIFLQIELHQDKKIEQYYSTHRNVKTPIANGCYECAACGNRKVREKDQNCPVCGIRFSSI